MDTIFDHNAPAAPEPPVTPTPETQPAPEAQTAQTAQTTTAPQPPQKVRRVGTWSFGMVLIAAGALLLAAVLVPGFDPTPVARFAPAILIVLGIEVLVYAARPNVKIKYDFLSMFACAFILLAVGGASLVPYLWNVYGPAADARLERLSTRIEDAVYTTIQAEPALKGVISYSDCYFYRDGVILDPAIAASESIDDLPRGARAYFTLAPAYPDAEAFAADCQRILVACADLPIEDYQFSNHVEPDGNVLAPEFHLSTDGRWLRDADLTTVANNVSTEWYVGDSWFSSKAEAEDYLAHSQAEEEEGMDEQYTYGYNDGYIAGYNTAMNGDEFDPAPEAAPEEEPAPIDETPREVG